MRCKGVGKRVEILKNKLRTLSFGHFGLILVMLLRYQPYDFDVIAQIEPLYGLERLHHKSFLSGSFFGHFGLILVMFLRSQSNNFDVIAHAGAPSGVE